MTTFYIIRHGETLFNTMDRIQGWCDSPLTRKGIHQMEFLRDGLSDIHFDAIYSSTSGRAMKCAQILAKDRNLDVNTLEDLREVSYGSLEGELFRNVWPAGKLDPIGYGRYGGEDLRIAKQRFISAMQHIAMQNPDSNVAILASGHVIKQLLSELDERFTGEDFETANLIPCCSVTKVTFKDNHFSLDALPDISWRRGC